MTSVCMRGGCLAKLSRPKIESVCCEYKHFQPRIYIGLELVGWYNGSISSGRLINNRPILISNLNLVTSLTRSRSRNVSVYLRFPSPGLH